MAFRLPDTETRPIDELMALPEAELGGGDRHRSAGARHARPARASRASRRSATARCASPAATILFCGIPIGADPQAYLEAAQTSTGPPDVPGGPPHFTAGMFAELIVEAA